MTERTDVARGRDIVARWSTLAEQRLEYLTALFETGRWQRYHSEREFLENIREAKSAVATWRGLLNAEATPDNRPVDFSWIGRRSSVPPVHVLPEPILEIAPRLAELPVAPPVSVVPATAEPEPEPEPEPELAPEPVLAIDPVETAGDSALDKTLALTLDIVGMAGRYPSLQNAFQSWEKN
jgi:uncharacterized repeat protein (TIGR03809 family)